MQIKLFWELGRESKTLCGDDEFQLRTEHFSTIGSCREKPED
jgi:hypothetical protein